MKAVYNLYQNLSSGVCQAPQVRELVTNSYRENPEATIRVLFYARDCRGGAGRRHAFRVAINILSEIDPQYLVKFVKHIPEYGRWDDMFYVGENLKESAFDVIGDALRSGDGLAAKWMPREKSSRKEEAKELRKHLGLTPKGYRKLLVDNTNVPENKFCANDWESIDMEKMPSLCLTRNTQALEKHVPDKVNKFVEDLKSGNANSNLGNASPIELVRMAENGKIKRDLFDNYWKSLDNTVPRDAKILPMIDVSGSMNSPAYGSVSCMDIAIALGVYLSWNSQGFFKNHVMSFSKQPKLIYSAPEHGASAMIEAITSAGNVGLTTNFEAAMKSLLEKMKAHNVSKDDAPRFIMVFTDMAFNECESDYFSFSGSKKDVDIVKSYPDIAKKYQDAGYDVPDLIVWNIVSRMYDRDLNDTGVEILEVGEQRIYQISGFEKSVFQNILSADFDSIDLTPIKLMEHVIYNPRYDKLFD